jgi:hypothetical protein
LEEWDSAGVLLVKSGDEKLPHRRSQRQYDDLGILKEELERYPRKSELYALTENNALVIAYLQRRACDIARFGRDIADLTFPQPTLRGKTPQQIADVIEWMADVLQRPAWKRQEEEDKTRLTEATKYIQKYFDEK